MRVTDLMDLPETGGRADEIGGHVTIDAEEPVDYDVLECPRCGCDVWDDSIGHVCDGEFRDHPAGEPGVIDR